jgi:hypothetical protein
MNDSENGGVVFAPKVLDCIICRNFTPVWEANGDTGDEEIVYYCDVQGFDYGFAKPTKRVVCDLFEMTGGNIRTAWGNACFSIEEDM